MLRRKGLNLHRWHRKSSVQGHFVWLQAMSSRLPSLQLWMCPAPHAKPIAAVASQACTSPVPDSCASTFNSSGTANSLLGQWCHEMSRSMTQYSRAILWCAFAFNSCPKIMLPKHPHGVFFMMVVARPVYDLVRPLHFPFIGSCLLFAPNSSYTYGWSSLRLRCHVLPSCRFSYWKYVLFLFCMSVSSPPSSCTCTAYLMLCLTFSRSSCVSLASHSAHLPHSSVFFSPPVLHGILSSICFLLSPVTCALACALACALTTCLPANIFFNIPDVQ